MHITALFFDVTTFTVSLGFKGFLSVMANTAKSASINLFHGDLYGSLLHLGEESFLVTVFATCDCLFMSCAIKYHNAGFTPLKFEGLA